MQFLRECSKFTFFLVQNKEILQAFGPERGRKKERERERDRGR
jgi:hypothetical protein